LTLFINHLYINSRVRRRFQLQLSAYTNKIKRKKVQIVPKDAFANIESTKAAKDESSLAVAKEAARAAKYVKTYKQEELEKTSKAAEAAEEAAMTFVFELAA
jgi:hypothetical protein